MLVLVASLNQTVTKDASEAAAHRSMRNEKKSVRKIPQLKLSKKHKALSRRYCIFPQCPTSEQHKNAVSANTADRQKIYSWKKFLWEPIDVKSFSRFSVGRCAPVATFHHCCAKMQNLKASNMHKQACEHKTFSVNKNSIESGNFYSFAIRKLPRRTESLSHGAGNKSSTSRASHFSSSKSGLSEKWERIV